MPSTDKTIRINPAKTTKPPRSIEEEIAAAEARLRNLRERKKEEDRRELERNQKAIAALLRDERLDAIGIEQWRSAVKGLHALLLMNSTAADASLRQGDYPPGTAIQPGANTEPSHPNPEVVAS